MAQPTISASALPNGGSQASSVAQASSGSMRFPIDLEKQPFWISFSFYQYNMPSVVSQNVYYSDKGTIRLPLPNSMVDSQHVQYSAESLALLTGAAISQLQENNLVGAAAIGGLSAIGLGSDASRLINNPTAQAALQTQGVAVNPFLTVMFKQPSFKQHALEWKLAPSNQQESLELNAIINTFRGNMLPDQNGALGGSLLTYPNIVQVTISANDPSFFTYVFKPAVIETCDVNFTPSGQPSFFGSTLAPTEIQLRISLMEIEYWLSSDYGIQNGTGANLTPSNAIAAVKNFQNNVSNVINNGQQPINGVQYNYDGTLRNE